jgi:outer membrane biosynthesis protein TonB
VRVLEDGTIVEPQITKASGNAEFDKSCMDAVVLTRKVAPPMAAVERRLSLVFAGSTLAGCGLTARRSADSPARR